MTPLVLLSLLSSPFDLPEPEVVLSPREAQALTLDPGQAVIDFDVSPIRPEVAVALKGKLLFWTIGGATRSMALPSDLRVSAIAWHPLGQSLFLLTQHEVLTTPAASWSPKTLYRSKAPLRRLVVGPRPFQPIASYDDDEKDEMAVLAYRVFFGVKEGGKYSTHSVTENGARERTVPHAELPAGFHPAGHFLLWEDDKHCFWRTEYQHLDWEEHPASPLNVCKGTLTYTPNGAGLLQWQSGTNGVTLRMDKTTTVVAKDLRFESTPSSVPDGRGIVGTTKEGLRYVPIDVPLADVVNAWMFLQNPRDQELFSANTGLFRPIERNDQLYQLYDSENYGFCDDHGYDETTPSRPYMVTTDVFWELYAAAFEGTFVLTEKQVAVPAFWKFVQGANEALKKGRAAAAFAAMMAVRDGNAGGNPEAARILRSEGVSTSSVTGLSFDFGNLKPRSHYDRDPALQRYFRAFRYLTDLKLEGDDLEPLRKLPPAVVQDARTWIGAYLPFIAPSREGIVWDSGKVVFPLSWGMDNEVMYRTVFHSHLPLPEQITGPGGPRLLPSGLDVAAVLGSSLAESLLDEAGEFQKYPPLRPRIAALRKKVDASPGENLYQRWLSGLAAQWADPAGGAIDRKIWSRKRLQTGLASWATLRHTTLLVNERDVAECGEAGYEAIVLRTPRGYVEPDPATFEAIAGLFDASIAMVKARIADEELQYGLVTRLTESRDKTVAFRDIAKKEVAGQPLTPAEYEEILYVGRAAEHNFLIFKSLAQKDLALSLPDPISKVADVAAASPTGPFLLAGVGAPLEWDQVVPFFGRREIVKGSSYAYYETVSAQVLDDAEWRKKLPTLARPKWIDPYVSPASLTCPAQAP